MFVTYPQSGNGQRQVMSDHRRNMFRSFHLVVVSRDSRAQVFLSLSLKPSAREAKCCSSRWLLSFFSANGRGQRGLRWWLLVMDQAVTWLCWLRMVDERSVMLVAMVLPHGGNCFNFADGSAWGELCSRWSFLQGFVC